MQTLTDWFMHYSRLDGPAVDCLVYLCEGTRKLAAIAFFARPNPNETKSAGYDETWNECWDLGNGLLPFSRGTDHQRNGPRSSRSPTAPRSRVDAVIVSSQLKAQ